MWSAEIFFLTSLWDFGLQGRSRIF